MQKNIVVFEVEGGNDKGPDGHRKDTMPIVNAIKAHDGWDSEVIYYDNTKADEIFEKVSTSSGGYISRVNPGNIPGGEKGYFELLTRLSDAGLVGMSSPEKMMDYGAKDALVKLNGSAEQQKDKNSRHVRPRLTATRCATAPYAAEVTRLLIRSGQNPDQCSLWATTTGACR